MEVNIKYQKDSAFIDFDFDRIINPFVPNAPFLDPLKTSENLKIF